MIPQIGPDLTIEILSKIQMMQMLHKNHPRCHLQYYSIRC